MTLTGIRKAMLASLAVSLAFAPAAAYAQRPSANSLPDWSGVWQMVGPTVFDAATVEPPTGRAGEPGDNGPQKIYFLDGCRVGEFRRRAGRRPVHRTPLPVP